VTPLEKLAAYLDTRKDAPNERHLTVQAIGVDITTDDLRAVYQLAQQAETLKAGASCCGHPREHHTEEGCVNGWRWPKAGIDVIPNVEGCDCEMQGPTRLDDVPAAGVETMAPLSL
jgi:hypothetical protein